MRDQPDIEYIDVSIVMPCLNEAATIGNCVDVALEAIEILGKEHGLVGEVIVADNGSTDNSQQIAAEKGAHVVDVPSKGYGAALRGGFGAARGQYLVMGDSDMSYDFREAVPMILELAKGADLCMGSRFKGEIKPGAMPWKNRHIGNPVLSAVLRLFFRTTISDSHCGLRAIRKSAYLNLNLSSDGMEFASEMVLKSALQGLQVAEVPVTLSPDGRGRPPHLNPWRDGLRHLFYMFMLAPTWLFFSPAAVLACFGIAIFTLLIANPDSEMVMIGSFGIGDHWAVVGSSAIVISAQTFVVGCAVTIIGIKDGYMVASKRSRALLKKSTLGNWLLAGAVFAIIGSVWAVIIAGNWVQSGFGELNQIRGLIAAFSLVVVGMQLGFGGFLLSVAAGNRLKHDVVLK